MLQLTFMPIKRQFFGRPLQPTATATIAALALLLANAAGNSVTAADKSRSPNIILIMADDIGYECFGSYGSQQYQTPNLDRMAKEGVRFTHCYAQPLCTPSRVKLMTGLSNVRNYSAFSVLNSDQRTIGHRFQQAGYQTVVAGKWQLLGAEHYAAKFRRKGTWPDQAGFDHSCLWQVEKLGSRYWQPLLTIDGENCQFDGADSFGPEIVNQYVLDFMAQKHEKPFFIYYPMILVHDPFVPTPQSASRASKDRQQNFEEMVANMDKMIGRVVAKAEELAIADNTLILFCGDNGTHPSITSKLGDQTIVGGKGKMTDAGTRVALIAHWPGKIAQGKVCEDLVEMSDFLPTCLAAAGEPIPAGLDGQSFLPQLRGEPGQPRDSIFIYYCPRPERTKPARFARDQRWKLYGDGRFYDVANDVLEKRDLQEAESDELATAARRKLRAKLDSMPAEGQSLLKFVPNNR